MAGQLWVTDSIGGYMYSDNLSAKLRHAVQPMTKFRQFADVKDAAHQGLAKGDTFHWNVYGNIATQGTVVAETTTIPESNFTILQGTMTITEYANSVPYTAKLDDLSEHSVTEVINKVLKHDATKAFDTAVAAEFDKAQIRYVVSDGTAIGSFTTDGTATATATADLGKGDFGHISNYMKERNIPPYMGDDYVALARPSTFEDLRTDLEAIHTYTEAGFQLIWNGEIGRYRNFRFVEQTFIAAAGLGTPTSAWATAGDWCACFGEDTVAEAIAVPEQMRGKIPTDYGRSKGIAWYYLGGFANVHDTIGTTNLANTRMVLVDSAA